VQESGVVRTWEVARSDQLRGVIFDFLAGSQLNKDLHACVYIVHVCVTYLVIYRKRLRVFSFQTTNHPVQYSCSRQDL